MWFPPLPPHTRASQGSSHAVGHWAEPDPGEETTGQGQAEKMGPWLQSLCKQGLP